MSIFLVISTQVLLLLGAGLFSKAVDDFEIYKFNKGSVAFPAIKIDSKLLANCSGTDERIECLLLCSVGGDVAETGSGPGSFDTSTSVWHLPYGSPENNTATDGWSIFNG